jgi:hypothetical protein
MKGDLRSRKKTFLLARGDVLLISNIFEFYLFLDFFYRAFFQKDNNFLFIFKNQLRSKSKGLSFKKEKEIKYF